MERTERFFREPPLWANDKEKSRQGFLRSLQQLHGEILEFYDRVSPSDSAHRMRASAVQRVENMARTLWPSCELRVFGSFATGLYMPNSDIDVIVLNSGPAGLQYRLKTFAERLRKSSVGTNVDVRAKAKVPIVTFVERQSGLAFDVRFDVSQELQAVELIKLSLAEFPSLGPLYMVIKAFMQHKRLNEVYHTGGIASYTLFVMLKAFLMIHRNSISGRASSANTGSTVPSAEFGHDSTLDAGCRDEGPFFASEHLSRPASSLGEESSLLEQTPQFEHGSLSVVRYRESSFDAGFGRGTELGFLLASFFHFYGISLNVREYGISCRDGLFLFQKVQQGFYYRLQPDLLAVEDPLTPSNDIAKSSWNFPRIRDVFLKTYEILIYKHELSSSAAILSCILPD